MTPNKVPVKELVFSEVEGESGVKTIAFVDAPAIMVNWIAFAKEKEFKACFADESRGIILSPLAIPDLPIPRKDPVTGEPFMVTMSAETISEIQYRWRKEGRQNLANEMHDESRPVDGVVWFANFQSDGVNIMNPPAFKDLPIGTMFVMGKIDNPEVKKIQDGTYKGVSLDGFFNMDEAPPLELEQIEAITESILKF